ncbi:hypothetical protein I5M27_02910 [Adhaeribacter sp. BT258]|uniref:O-antigen ligase like membrane protein n=1 Tax=Adhaeribacter terrigena TaxID=2793070 RepID=A0ABS1BY06_9BACT|nr:hypothetical protein [Adhaeribacter terrigena]MBK0401918.1 hypothetical protein [Adhaeribacter terrigena]
MILLGLTILLIILFFYDTRTFVFALIAYFVFFDMFDGFYEENKVYAAIRYIVPLSLGLIYVFKYQALKKSDAVFIALVLYLLLLLVINSGDMVVSTRAFLSVLITLLMIPVGKHLGAEVDFIKEFEPYNRLLLYTIPAYIFVVNVLGIGGYYTEAFSTGFLITSRMYIVPIVVFLSVHYLLANPHKNLLVKLSDMTLILINISILILNTRRTAFGMLLGAIVIYALLNPKLMFKMVLFLFIAVGGLVVSYPLYQDRLDAQLEKRDRIRNLDTYEEEGRYLETKYLMDYHERRASMFEVFFGIKFFDSYSFGAKYFNHARPIHSDINMIFFSTGLIGVLFFTIFFSHYFLKQNLKIPGPNRKLFYPFLFMFLIVLIPGRFVGTLTFAPLLMLLLSTTKFGRVTSLAKDEPEPALTQYSVSMN